MNKRERKLQEPKYEALINTLIPAQLCFNLRSLLAFFDDLSARLWKILCWAICILIHMDNLLNTASTYNLQRSNDYKLSQMQCFDVSRLNSTSSRLASNQLLLISTKDDEPILKEAAIPHDAFFYRLQTLLADWAIVAAMLESHLACKNGNPKPKCGVYYSYWRSFHHVCAENVSNKILDTWPCFQYRDEAKAPYARTTESDWSIVVMDLTCEQCN